MNSTKIEAKTRLLSLTKKQKQLDINKDGKIDGEDLKKVRKGEKPERSSYDSRAGRRNTRDQVKASVYTFAQDFLKLLANEMNNVAYGNMSSEEEREDYVSNSAEEQLDYALSCLYGKVAKYSQAGKKYPDEMKAFVGVPIDKQLKLLLPYFKRAT
jgi:hypothetical protein